MVKDDDAGAGPLTGNARLELRVIDFGPVTNGTVVLKPLTVFVGPNGSGKSQVATIIHSAITAESESYAFAPSDNTPATDTDLLLRNEALRIYQEHVVNGHDTVTSPIYEKISECVIRAFPDRLIHNLAIPHNNLIRMGRQITILSIRTPNIHFWCGSKDNGLECTPKSGNSTEKLKVEFTDRRTVQYHPAKKQHRSINRVAVPRNYTANDLYGVLKETLARRVGVTRSIYFPAERGGLTLSHKPIISNYYDRLGRPAGDLPDPSLSGVATNFLAWLVHMPKKEGPFAGMVRDFETRALSGEIVMKQDSVKAPDLFFRQLNTHMPLHTASSSIKDLAVFLLCAKHAMKPRDLLILEEPEANLHPSNQILMAGLVARLVNAGLYVLINTHSEFFLEQLGHCVLARKGKSAVPESENLDADDVAAYRFVRDGNGHTIQPMAVTEDGIPQTEFTDVFDKMYDELLDLKGQSA